MLITHFIVPTHLASVQIETVGSISKYTVFSCIEALAVLKKIAIDGRQLVDFAASSL